MPLQNPPNGIRMRVMEPILDYLKRNLRAAGPRAWPAISAATGCSLHTMRKVAYNDIENPGVVTMQPLLDYFQQAERNEKQQAAA